MEQPPYSWLSPFPPSPCLHGSPFQPRGRVRQSIRRSKAKTENKHTEHEEENTDEKSSISATRVEVALAVRTPVVSASKLRLATTVPQDWRRTHTYTFISQERGLWVCDTALDGGLAVTEVHS